MLTPEQIQKIDWFFEDNGLEFYDLRIEFVDHLSEAIEGKMKADSGMSFEQAFKEETGKFSRRDLAIQINRVYDQYNPFKEWRYFTFQRVIGLLVIFLLLILPITFLNKQLLVYIEVFYLLAGTGWYLRCLLAFKTKYKAPRKKLSVYFSKGLFDYLLSIHLYWLLFIKIQMDTPLPVEEKWFFVLFVFLELFSIATLLAKINAKKQEFHAAKKAYPRLFEN